MMKATLVILALIGLACAFKLPGHISSKLAPRELLVDHDLIKQINGMDSTWTAGVNERWQGVTRQEFVRMLGVKPHGNRMDEKEITPLLGLPKDFDSRTQWPGCIGPVLDQGHCGSCWAFGAVESLEDRFCIQSNGSIKLDLSEQDLVSCDESNSGCGGGQPGSAWGYLKSTGAVTEACYPYEMGTCQHPGCSEEPTPRCNKTCADHTNWKQEKHFAASGYSIGSDVSKIATEILTHGPVEGTFAVYEDFAHYVSGVYAHTTGNLLGFHAIKIIGWGVQNTTNYWLVQNSWNESWGMKGYFMIQSGVNMCGIESGIAAGLAKI